MRRGLAGLILDITSSIALVLKLFTTFALFVIVGILVVGKTIPLFVGLLIFFIGTPLLKGVTERLSGVLGARLIAVARSLDQREVDRRTGVSESAR
jgi:predicted ABC-type sugar transport system permease subunit